VRTMAAIWSVLVISCIGVDAAQMQEQMLCPDWGPAEEIGELDRQVLDEASGLAVSSRFDNRLYHVDDSATTLFVTDFSGDPDQVVQVSGPKGRDIEDLALGRCGDQSCLFIADIGDNDMVRETIEIVLEVDQFPVVAEPLGRVRLRYPDGPRDAEALAVHPDGDVFVMTRHFFPPASETHAQLFRLAVATWGEQAGAVETLDPVAPIDFRRLSDTLPNQLVIAMDFSSDGRRMLVLTYQNAFEFQIDASSPTLNLDRDLVEDIDYREIEPVQLRQQEAIAYSGDGFVYGTEAGGGRSPLMRVRCRR
jgi:hypothetical protein